MTPPCPCDCLNICHRVDPLEQLGVNCCAPGHLQLYTTAKRSLHSLSQHIDFDKSQLLPQLLPHFSVCFLQGADPSLAALTDVFKDAGCRGINQQKSPILSVQSQVDQIAIEKPSSPTHQVAGRDFMLRDSCRLQLIMASSNLNFNILYIYTYIRI